MQVEEFLKLPLEQDEGGFFVSPALDQKFILGPSGFLTFSDVTIGGGVPASCLVDGPNIGF